MSWQLAQVNLALPVEPLDSARLADFMAALDPVNALADAADGFVWRLQSDSGDATDIRGTDDRIIVNMSVWESVEQLRAYTYAGPHAEILKQRRDWFEKFERVAAALWWVPAGHIPTMDEAKERLASLDARGPTPFAFTFKAIFDPESSDWGAAI